MNIDNNILFIGYDKEPPFKKAVYNNKIIKVLYLWHTVLLDPVGDIQYLTYVVGNDNEGNILSTSIKNIKIYTKKK